MILTHLQNKRLKRKDFEEKVFNGALHSFFVPFCPKNNDKLSNFRSLQSNLHIARISDGMSPMQISIF